LPRKLQARQHYLFNIPRTKSSFMFVRGHYKPLDRVLAAPVTCWL